MLELGMALRLKGMASADGVADAAGVSVDEATAALAAMVEAGHAQDSPRGFRLTPDGKARLDELLADERAGLDPAATNAVYDRFCEYNGAFKQLITDWQVREIDGEQVMNDHTDTAYDAAIIERLGSLHDATSPVFADAAALAPRLERYWQRFEVAIDAARAGDQTMVAAPLKDSYHTVWFEMHEELILLSGRNRADEAAAGRGA